MILFRQRCSRAARLLAFVVIATCATGCNPFRDNVGFVGEDAGTGDLPVFDVFDQSSERTDASSGSEVCGNGLDDDGNGNTDEHCACQLGLTQRCFVGDRALAGIGTCVLGSQTCFPEGEFGAWGPCAGSGGPAEERCNEADDNCDGTVDEGCTCAPGMSRSCGGEFDEPPIGVCRIGSQQCLEGDGFGAWAACVGAVLPSAERCANGQDDDCDGMVDEGCVCNPDTTRLCYEDSTRRPGTGTPGVGICANGAQHCVSHAAGGSDWSVCDGPVLPSPEVCDGLDNDCNGQVDELCPCTVGSRRPCGIEAGACAPGMQTCVAAGTSSMLLPCIGHIDPLPEACGNAADDDCDGSTNEDCLCTPGMTRPCSGGSSVGTCIPGIETCEALTTGGSNWNACVGSRGPGIEVCGDVLDNDCDGGVDDGCVCTPRVVRPCPGGSSVGACRPGSQTCHLLSAGGSDWGICVGIVRPSPEFCGDGVDNDCDGAAEEMCLCVPGTSRLCAGSSVGACSPGTQTCEMLAAGGSNWSACVDVRNPSPEMCADGVDNDCDGATDEMCVCVVGQTRPCPTGTDDGVCERGNQTCVALSAGGTDWGVCVGAIGPSPETCMDGLDNDCDTAIDCRDIECAGGAMCCTETGATFDVPQDPADVLFIMDRSGSMVAYMPGTTTTRWDALRTAMSTVLPTLETELYMGLLVFPDLSGYLVSSTPDVPIALMNAAAMTARLTYFSPPDGGTPTLEALTSAQNYFRTTTSPRPRFIVLATDGEPNSGVPPVTAKIMEIRSTLGIDTFVLGVPGSSTTLHNALNQMADAGGRALVGTTRYHTVASTMDFERALRAVTTATTDCSYILPSVPFDPNLVTVRFDAVTVPRSMATGWEYTDATHREIRFYGTSCAQLVGGYVRRVTAAFSCPP